MYVLRTPVFCIDIDVYPYDYIHTCVLRPENICMHRYTTHGVLVLYRDSQPVSQ